MPDSVSEVRIARLKSVARERKRSTLEKAEKAVRQLLANNEPVSFANVARQAGVSVSYLYKYPEFKRNLQELRRQQDQRGRSKVKAPAPSDKSKERVISHLRQRIKELEAERAEMKKHIESLSGQFYELNADKELVHRLRAENEKLSKQLKVNEQDAAVSSTTSEMSPIVVKELYELEIRLSTSLKDKILSRSEEHVKNAIAVVHEAVAAGNVRSKSRLFVKALEEGWEPGEDSSVFEKKREVQEFSRWFDAAKSKGLVQASRGTEKDILVLTSKGKWIPYLTLRDKLEFAYG